MARSDFPLSPAFQESDYFKTVIRPDGAFLYAKLRRIALREALPADVRAILGDRCVVACATFASLAAQTGKSVKTVQRQLQLLEGERWIRKLERRGLPSAYILADGKGYFADRAVRAVGLDRVCDDPRTTQVNLTSVSASLPGSPKRRGRKKGPSRSSGASCAEAGDCGVCASFPRAISPSNPGQIDLGGCRNNIESIDSSLSNKKHSPLSDANTQVNLTGVENPLAKKRRGWRTLPLSRWGYKTLWDMIFDRLLETGIAPVTMDESARSKLRSLLKHYPMDELRRVGEFFAENYRELRKAYDWRGSPSGRLFGGWYTVIREHADGRPITPRKQKKNLDRGGPDALRYSPGWRTFGEGKDDATKKD